MASVVFLVLAASTLAASTTLAPTPLWATVDDLECSELVLQVEKRASG